jgi:hypothetical protein
MSDQERSRREGEPSPTPPDPPEAIRTLNDAIRLELRYLDRAVASPFRAVRRTLGQSSRPWAQSLGEMVWAMEGMARLPVKVLQAAFGEDLAQPPETRRRS